MERTLVWLLVLVSTIVITDCATFDTPHVPASNLFVDMPLTLPTPGKMVGFTLPELKSTKPVTKNALDPFIAKMVYHHNEGQTEMAMLYAEEMLKIHITRADIWAYYASMLINIGRYEEALPKLNASLRHENNNVKVIRNLIGCLYIMEGRASLHYKDYEKLLIGVLEARSTSKKPLTLFILASIFSFGGQYKRSLDIYQQIVKSKSEYAVMSLFHMANIHEIFDDDFKAKELYRSSWELLLKHWKKENPCREIIWDWDQLRLQNELKFEIMNQRDLSSIKEKVIVVRLENVVLEGTWLIPRTECKMVFGSKSFADAIPLKSPYVFTDAPQTRKMRLDKVAIIPSQIEGNFYHMYVEVLARVEIFRRGVMNKDSDIKLLLPEHYITLMTEIYHKRAPKFLKRVMYAVPEIVYEVQNAYIADWSYSTYSESTIPKSHLPIKSSITALNEFLLGGTKYVEAPVIERSVVLYFSRTHFSDRFVIGEDELFEKLKKTCASYGHNMVKVNHIMDEEKRSYILARTRVIIGPHGEGLGNAIYIEPKGASLIEFPVEGGTSQNYAKLASDLGLAYHRIGNMTTHMKGHYVVTPQAMKEINNALVWEMMDFWEENLDTVKKAKHVFSVL